QRLDLATAPLDMSKWVELVPPGILASQPAVSPRPPSKKASMPTAGVDAPQSVQPLAVLQTLADHGVLRTYETGGLDISPRWVRAAIERDTVVHAVQTGNASWTQWAVDEWRRDLV